MDNFRLAYLLDQEALCHVKLASIAEEPSLSESHLEVAYAQLQGATLLRKEARQECVKSRRSAAKKHLYLKPLKQD